jgi:outer membrane lipoprotein SlyB
VEREVIMHPTPGNDQSTIGSRTERRSPNTARAAGIGAVAGAIVGGAAGRSVKSAAIGAAAGGILGVIAAQASRPPIRGIRS